jgi:hypothetical protein
MARPRKADAPMALMTVSIPGANPGIEGAAAALGVAADVIDRAYGIVPIDPKRNLYAVQVRADALPKGGKGEPYSGPFANPRIEPFGPRRG